MRHRLLVFSISAEVREQKNLCDYLRADWIVLFGTIDILCWNHQHFGKEVSNTQFLHW